MIKSYYKAKGNGAMNYRLRKAIIKQNLYHWNYPIFDSENHLPQSEKEIQQLIIDCRRLKIHKICTSEYTHSTLDILATIKSICHLPIEVDNVPCKLERDYITNEPIYISQPGFCISISN